MSKLLSIFKISRGYTRCVIWHGSRAHQKVGTSTITPNKELSREEKYKVIADYLRERSGISAPPYQPTNGNGSKQK